MVRHATKVPSWNKTVCVAVAGYAPWSLGHKTSKIMSCKRTISLTMALLRSFPCCAARVSDSRPRYLLWETQVWKTPCGWCPRVSPMSSVLFYFCGCCTNKEQLCACHDQSWHWETGSQPCKNETSSILQSGWWKLCDDRWIQLTEWVRMRCLFQQSWRFGVPAE